MPSDPLGSVVGSTSPGVVIAVTNTCGPPIGPLDVSFTGTHASEFVLAASGCSGVSLAQDASCTITVRFAPATAGTKMAQVSVGSTPTLRASANLGGTSLTP